MHKESIASQRKYLLSPTRFPNVLFEEMMS
jgi:hypothetical protein